MSPLYKSILIKTIELWWRRNLLNLFTHQHSNIFNIYIDLKYDQIHKQSEVVAADTLFTQL